MSVFKKTPKLTPEWPTPFEHGFSQLVDWILWIENHKGNAAFVNNRSAVAWNPRFSFEADGAADGPIAGSPSDESRAVEDF